MSGTSRNGSRSANGENAPNPEVVGKAKRRRFSSANKLRIEPVPVSRTSGPSTQAIRSCGESSTRRNSRNATSSCRVSFGKPGLPTSSATYSIGGSLGLIVVPGGTLPRHANPHFTFRRTNGIVR